MSGGADAGLERALQISRELLEVAEHGDVRGVAALNAERLRLLQALHPSLGRLDAGERLMLQEISQLNDQALGLVEHRRRRTERKMDMAAVGRRALTAYSATGMLR
jgi:hypothetical protein